MKKYIIATIAVLVLMAGSYALGRYLVPPEIKTQTQTVEKIVVQQRTFLSVKTRTKTNTKTVIERIALPDGTVVEKSVETDRSITDTGVAAVQASEASVDKEQQSKTVIAAPKSSVTALLGTNLALDPYVGINLQTPVGPANAGAFLLVPTTKPAESIVGVTIGVSF